MILACTGCGKSLKIADEHAGRRARCPNCRTVIAVPLSGDSHANEPVMQPAASAAAGVASQSPVAQQTPLPMSSPGSVYDQPPIDAPSKSTALVPAPAMNNSSEYASPNYHSSQPAPSHYQPQVQPYNPNEYQQQYAPSYQRPRQAADPGIAALLEVLGGMFAQTFGMGHIYAGNVGTGLLFMFGYWFLCFINIILMFAIIGVLTYPLCWIMIMIISPIVAANSVKRH